MLGKKKQQLAYLKIEWAELKWQIAEAKGSDADLDVKYHYLNDLQYAQFLIDEQIDELEHEIAMFPVRLMLVGFVIFVFGMIVYMAM
jgi:hypothetical protein